MIETDNSQPPFNVRTLASLQEELLAPTRMYGALLTAFAVLALILVSVGLYGLMAYFVTNRTREFGIRFALGARAADIGRLVLREAGRFVAIAIVLGGAAALGAARALRALLFGVTPTDWLSLVGALSVLVTVACAQLWRRSLVPLIAAGCLIASLSAVSHAQSKSDPEVVFNTQSLIYHRASCSAAQRCTKNCIVVRLSTARKRGGRACKICGGPRVDLVDSFTEVVAENATPPAKLWKLVPGLVSTGYRV